MVHPLTAVTAKKVSQPLDNPLNAFIVTVVFLKDFNLNLAYYYAKDGFVHAHCVENRWFSCSFAD